jgi:hypothetical protein
MAFALVLLGAAWGAAGPLNTGYLAPSAASQGMGGAHAALGGDAEDFILNPATLARQAPSVDFQGASLFDGGEWLLGSTAVFPMPEAVVGALSSHRLWNDQARNYQQAWMLSLGLPLSKAGESSLGVSLKYVDSDYGDPGHGWGFDVGLLHRLDLGKATLALAASVLDVDSTLAHNSGSDERIPQVLKLALGLEWMKSLRFGVDNDFANVGAPNSVDSRYTLHAGVENFFWRDRVVARLGYVNVSSLDGRGLLAGSTARATFGLGLRYENLFLDYAFLAGSQGAGISQRLGVTLSFASRPRPVAPRAKAPAQPVALRGLAPNPQAWPRTHVVKPGEDLYGIAALPEVYGEGQLWPLLYDANWAQISDARHIVPGMILAVPKPGTEAEKNIIRNRAGAAENKAQP